MKFILKYKIVIIIAIIILIAGGIYVYNMRFLNDDGQNEIIQNNGEKSYIENILDNSQNKKEGKIVVHVTGAVKKTGVVILDEGGRIYEAIEKAEGTLENADLSQINLAYMLEDGQRLYIPFKGDIIEEGVDGETIGGTFRNSENGNNTENEIRDSGKENNKNNNLSEIRNSENENNNSSKNNIRNSENKDVNSLNGNVRDSENKTINSSESNIRNSGKIKKVITSDFSDSENISDNLDSENKGGKKESVGKVNINTAKQTELETLPGVGTVTAGKIIEYRNKNGKYKSVEDIKNVSGIGDSKYEKIKEYITIK